MSPSNNDPATTAGCDASQDTEEQEIAQILRDAVTADNIILPRPFSVIQIPVVLSDAPPEGMSDESAAKFRNLSITHKTAKYVIHMAKKQGFKDNNGKTDIEKKALLSLTRFLSLYLRNQDGKPRKFTSWKYVNDFLSTPRRQMEVLILEMPASAARDEAQKALKLPAKKERKAPVQPSDKKRKAADDGQQTQKKAKKSSKASTSDL